MEQISYEFGTDSRCNVAVDLTPMISGGVNGGVKPAVLTFLRVLENEYGDTFRFILLTNSSTHNDLLWLVRPEDLMLCILEPHRGEISQVMTPAHNVRILKRI